MKRAILEFCGIKPVKITTFAPLKFSSDADRKKWIEKVEALGRNQK